MTRAATAAGRRTLVAGVGNVLRGDDGFGPAVVRALEAAGLPPGVRSIEVGIGGMGIVQELLEAEFDAVLIVDAIDRGGAPGTLHVLEPELPEPAGLAANERLALATGSHQLIPTRTLIVARALGVLPPLVRIIGCQPAATEELTTELSPAVAAAVPETLALLRRLLGDVAPEPTHA